MPEAQHPPHVTHEHTPAAQRPKDTPVRVFEFDATKPLVEGRNPGQIDTFTIPFEPRIPRREKAARIAIATRCPGRDFDIRHATDGAVVATLYVKPTGSPFEVARIMDAHRAAALAPVSAPLAAPARRASAPAASTVQTFPAPTRRG